jgi:hypothetical protein
MGDDKKKELAKGLRVGDYHVRPAPALSTSNTLDDEANRERARRAEEDRRAAQFGGGGGGAGETHEGAALSAVDKAIEEARAEAAGGEDIPILLRDPVTGAAFKLP